MRALVISGGGAKGAFAGGVCDYLLNDLKRSYDIFIGTSTGSLIAPHLAINSMDAIKDAYTNVKPEDIYNVNPFKMTYTKEGELKATINKINAVNRLMRGKKTFGETKNLRKTITRVLSEEKFNAIKKTDKKVIITASNLSTSRTEYKYLHDYDYENFCDWLWISCCFVPFMSLVEKNGYQYADGGFGNYIPVEEAINLGATEVDVIVLNPRHKKVDHVKSKNAFDLLLNSMLFMTRQVAYNDILIGHLESIYNNDVKVNFIFTPRLLTKYSFHFDPKQMKEWWQEGYEFAHKKFTTKNQIL